MIKPEISTESSILTPPPIKDVPKFEWNAQKSQETWEKRFICFKCVEKIWNTKQPKHIIKDERYDEPRFNALFEFDDKSDIFVTFTFRETAIRIISCRRKRIQKDKIWESKIREYCLEDCQPIQNQAREFADICRNEETI